MDYYCAEKLRWTVEMALFLYYNALNVCKHLYTDWKGAFVNSTHFRSKWTTWGPHCKMSLTSLLCVIACNPNNTVQLKKCNNLFLLSFETSSCSVVSIGKYFSCLVWAIINCRQHQKCYHLHTFIKKKRKKRWLCL